MRGLTLFLISRLWSFLKQQRLVGPLFISLFFHCLLVVLGVLIWMLTPPLLPAMPELIIALEPAESVFKDEKKFIQSPPRGEAETETSDESVEYSSDRRVRVKKQQRARHWEETPKAAHSRKKKIDKSDSDMENLARFGIPLEPRKQDRIETGEQHAAGPLLDPKLPLGSEQLLNTDRMRYYSFYNRIYEQVRPLWQKRVGEEITRNTKLFAGTFVTELEMSLDSKGHLVGVRILRPSGVEEFDEIAKAQIQKTRDFPNPPKQLLDEYGEAHIGWSFLIELDADVIRFERMKRLY